MNSFLFLCKNLILCCVFICVVQAFTTGDSEVCRSETNATDKDVANALEKDPLNYFDFTIEARMYAKCLLSKYGYISETGEIFENATDSDPFMKDKIYSEKFTITSCLRILSRMVNSSDDSIMLMTCFGLDGKVTLQD